MEAESSGKEALSAKCEQLAQMTIGNFLLDQVYNESAWNPELGSRIGFPWYGCSHRQTLWTNQCVYI